MGILDNNYISQLRNINARLGDPNITYSEREGLDSQRADTALNMGLAGLLGGTQLAGQFVMNGMGADTPMYDAALAGMSRGRGHNTFNNTQLLDYHNSIPEGFETNVEDLNRTPIQSAANIGSSMLTGAATGANFGPAGLILGTGLGYLGAQYAEGRAKAINQQNVNIANAAQAYEKGLNATELRSNADIAKETMFGTQYGQRKAAGGFLKAIGSKSRYFQHSHCKGGTLVRIKTK